MARASLLRTGIISGLAFGLAFGAWMAVTGSLLAGAAAGVVGGLLFGAVTAGFVGVMARRTAANRPALAGETVAREGTANHVAGIESRGGWLYLTDDALQFRAHKLNVQRHALTIPLGEIAAVAPARALGVVPNAITVTTADGKRQKFVVNDRAGWIAAIEAARQGS